MRVTANTRAILGDQPSDWVQDGACKGKDPELFFPARGVAAFQQVGWAFDDEPAEITRLFVMDDDPEDHADAVADRRLEPVFRFVGGERGEDETRASRVFRDQCG